jgi:S-adenosylmethionine:tRNA ribosyltransferase-isomerase
MRTADFDYELPPELIAQAPAQERDQSRLMVVNRRSGEILHKRFADLLEFLCPNDLLVLNNSRVVPARLRGMNARTGGRFELLLLEQATAGVWWSMLRPAKRARVGTEITLLRYDGTTSGVSVTVTDTNVEGHRLLKFHTPEILPLLEELGEVPLPPYIRRSAGNSSPLDKERYQTVFASNPGSIAAPTAGLHFTPTLLDRARKNGVKNTFVTLHVGLSTFAPVKATDLTEHRMHEERFEVTADSAGVIAETRRAGARVVAVGTTALRVLESVGAAHDGAVIAGPGRTRLFVHPPYHFHVVDALLTNFHLPCSTLLMLVSAFAAPGGTGGVALVRRAYQEAIQARYRFFSYGDAMLLL